MSNEIYLTKEGLEDIKKELEYLKLEKRPEVINALKDARSQGDLSENAEYDAARTEQALVESKISELETMINKAIIIDKIQTDKVGIGNRVTVKYIGENDTDVYTIVGSKEVDPFENKISNESPIAKAIMGYKVGDVVTVDSPNGKYDVEIVGIA